MAKFEYNRGNPVLEAYGKKFPIPTKTARLIDDINKINEKLSKAADAVQNVTAIREGIAVFIGEEEAEALFPSAKLPELDSDELSAFWFALNAESNRATNEIIAKYSPNPNIRKAK